MIKYPKRINEAEVETILVNKLKSSLPSEYNIRQQVYGKIGLKRSRFDIVVFFEEQPYVIIEVKKQKKLITAKQEKEYRAYGIPFIHCYNQSCVKRVVEQIQYHLQGVSPQVR